jgi:hypothetical protein
MTTLISRKIDHLLSNAANAIGHLDLPKSEVDWLTDWQNEFGVCLRLNGAKGKVNWITKEKKALLLEPPSSPTDMSGCSLNDV